VIIMWQAFLHNCTLLNPFCVLPDLSCSQVFYGTHSFWSSISSFHAFTVHLYILIKTNANTHTHTHTHIYICICVCVCVCVCVCMYKFFSLYNDTCVETLRGEHYINRKFCFIYISQNFVFIWCSPLSVSTHLCHPQGVSILVVH